MHYSDEVENFILPYRKHTQDNMYQILSDSAGFVEDITKRFGVFLSVHNSNCRSLKKRECYVSQGSVDTLLR